MKQLTTLFLASLVMALAATQSAATKNPRSHPHRDRAAHGVRPDERAERQPHRRLRPHCQRNSSRRAGTYATGGNGGVAAAGRRVGPSRVAGLARLRRRHSLLIAVNAGSDTVSTFKVRGDRLQLKDVVPSGGEFPASIAVHRDLVYVLNSGGTGDRPGLPHPRPPAAADQRLGAVARASRTPTRRTS